MFEDSLVESSGMIRTRSRRYAAGSLVLQAALLAVAVLIPYIYPAALPPHALLTPLAAPPPPEMPAQQPDAIASRSVAAVRTIDLTAPSVIPRHITQGEQSSSGPPEIVDIIGNSTGKIAGSLLSTVPAAAPPVVRAARPAGPLRVSAGVAAGQLLAPIQPQYPVIARTVGVQGTVVIEAVISTAGTVEQARVVSGPPLLTQAALDAVSRARYRPYLLNGQPIAVETTIRIIFSLGD